jgi:hypothetical protein
LRLVDEPISTKPKPRDWPVNLSEITFADCTCSVRREDFLETAFRNRIRQAAYV